MERLAHGFIHIAMILMGFFADVRSKSLVSGRLHDHLQAQQGNEDLKTDNYNSTVLFYLYTKSNVAEPQQLWKDDVTKLKASNYNHTKETKIVTHGFLDNLDSDAIQMIKNALLTFEDVNVIGVDWSHYSKDVLYADVVVKVPGVGNYIGQFANFLIDEGLNPRDLHIMGHSLGAHAAGFAGKELNANGKTAARVSGFDPAGPGFIGANPSSRLASTDADFVDCIHTCAGFLGFEYAICDADFYPNGGINVQPGCPWWDLGTCSHGRSFEYFAESINKTHHFYGEMCASIDDGKPYGCNSGEIAEMGYFASDENLGEYYLTTRSSSPYALNITSSAERYDLGRLVNDSEA